MTMTADRIVACIKAADYPALFELYAPDVVLDMNLPMWRFQHHGAEQVRDYFQEQTGSITNLHSTSIRHTVGDDRVVVESEARFDNGGECLWRCVDLFTIESERITEHVQYCTGGWSPDVIARQAAEAPMVRW